MKTAHRLRTQTAEAVSITDQADQIFERAIDERIIGRLGLFDRSERRFRSLQRITRPRERR